jgi:hypothetical protein
MANAVAKPFEKIGEVAVQVISVMFGGDVFGICKAIG